MKFILSASNLILLLFISTGTQAQEVIAASGGIESSASAIVSWTIGETVTETATGTNIILSQGFNQGDLILTVIKDPDIRGLEVKVYPNPASDVLKISVGEYFSEDIDYAIINMEGQVLKKNTLKGGESVIPIGNLSPSVYFLKLYRNNTELAIIKIIKNK